MSPISCVYNFVELSKKKRNLFSVRKQILSNLNVDLTAAEMFECHCSKIIPAYFHIES